MANAPQPPLGQKKVDPKEWERKQRLKEYRIAARREKRNRKSDEKKQRKLNATILRRMTRNPDKYNKNAGRNRLIAIEKERQKIRRNAVRAVERLAAVYDPSGQMFNVSPVATLEDGRVIPLDALERRRQREKYRELKEAAIAKGEDPPPPPTNGLVNGMNPQRAQIMQTAQLGNRGSRPLSKTQQRKLRAFDPRPPPPKPVIPEGYSWPEDEDENWLSMWDFEDGELERRVLRAKKQAAAARKDLRRRQKEGKAERRAARDEKRRVYRQCKEEWKKPREDERRQKKAYLSVESRERRKLADQVNVFEREQALEYCASLGFTLDNVEGVNEIQPRALGMKGMQVDFNILEPGDKPSELKVKSEKAKPKSPKSDRIDLGAVPDESKAIHIQTADDMQVENMMQDYIKLGGIDGEDQAFEQVDYNHKVRRKLRRALLSAKMKREALVREKTIEYLKERGEEIPEVLKTSVSPVNKPQPRALENGALETAKQERVRARVELTEFNNAARVLRKQAKEKSIYAGLKIYAELMGLIPRKGSPGGQPEDVEMKDADQEEDNEDDSDSDDSDSDERDSDDGSGSEET